VVGGSATIASRLWKFFLLQEPTANPAGESTVALGAVLRSEARLDLGEDLSAAARRNLGIMPA